MANELSPKPVLVVIAGREVRLSYAFRAVLQYQRETARIELSRPRTEDPNPRCICGARKSEHKGPLMVRVSTDPVEILCPRFRVEDVTAGDSLFDFEAWRKIDLNVDPERWIACLWCGMHERQSDGTWKAPFTQAELEESIGISPETREISEKMFDAISAWMPKQPKTTSPNVAAPGELAQASVPNPSTSSSSAPVLESGTDLASTSS